VDTLKELASGDLRAEIHGEFRGDHAVMQLAFNTAMQSLDEILSHVTEAVEQVNSGSGQVSESSQALAEGATDQAAALQEISSSLAEVSEQTRQNSSHAAKANQLTSAACEAADEGNRQMQKMLNAMTAINNSSSEISKIIKAIDEIAFQTNLLALNAAVEAARAGVQGKGFAVVADEVRNLAQRSARAAQETTELIAGSVRKVGRGTELAKETARALGEIVSSATQASDLVEEINNASTEQSLGLEQVSQALHQIDRVTQRNAASADETASAAAQLSGRAQTLRTMLTRFRLKETLGNRAEELQAPDLQRPGDPAGGPASKARRPREANEKPRGAVDPEELISLDDRDFGDF